MKVDWKASKKIVYLHDLVMVARLIYSRCFTDIKLKHELFTYIYIYTVYSFSNTIYLYSGPSIKHLTAPFPALTKS